MTLTKYKYFQFTHVHRSVGGAFDLPTDMTYFNA